MQTRRSFLCAVAAAGGHPATFVAMQALGLIPISSSKPLRLQRGVRHNTRVAVLGAGIAGLSAAYELRAAGYDCTLIEARGRSGGRNWTIRHGTELRMLDGTSQRCEFDPGLYWNAGPARIPAQHEMILGYCRAFGVRLEVEINSSRAAQLVNPQANGGRPIQLRQAVNDTRGAVSELLAKAIGRGSLDKELTASDKERVLAFLRQYGDLSPDLLYKGSSRSGYRKPPGAASRVGVRQDPISLDVLLDEDLWNGVLFEDLINQQATMFQPVGGMDQVPAAFEARLRDVLHHNCEVMAIRRRDEGVRIEYRNVQTGQSNAVDAEYCISTLPPVVLSKIPSDFSASYKAALANIEYVASVKIAWQARRFWEQDFGIYGGISWVHGLTSMVWYPSGELFADQGVLIGAYTNGDLGALLSSRPLQDQFKVSRQAIKRLHPGHDHELKRPMAISWSKIPYSLGEGARYQDGDTADYDLLNRPDGPFYFAGDYLSQIGTWQESAISSARYTINMLDEHRRTSSHRMTPGPPAGTAVSPIS
jgi:monoamine oxidase